MSIDDPTLSDLRAKMKEVDLGRALTRTAINQLRAKLRNSGSLSPDEQKGLTYREETEAKLTQQLSELTDQYTQKLLEIQIESLKELEGATKNVADLEKLQESISESLLKSSTANQTTTENLLKTQEIQSETIAMLLKSSSRLEAFTQILLVFTVLVSILSADSIVIELADKLGATVSLTLVAMILADIIVAILLGVIWIDVMKRNKTDPVLKARE